VRCHLQQLLEVPSWLASALPGPFLDEFYNHNHKP
jgi:hypothetical protein